LFGRHRLEPLTARALLRPEGRPGRDQRAGAPPGLPRVHGGTGGHARAPDRPRHVPAGAGDAGPPPRRLLHAPPPEPHPAAPRPPRPRLLVCAACGAFMTGGTRPDGRRYYKCSTYLRSGGARCFYNLVYEGAVLGDVIRAVQRFYLNSDRLAELRSEMLR